jgi:hypothetical protein
MQVALEVRPVVGAVAIGVDGQRGLQLGEPLERRGRLKPSLPRKMLPITVDGKAARWAGSIWV